MAAIWAIADLHLSFGVPNKKMDIFSPHWTNHAEKIEEKWRATVSEEDLVLIAGDISWGMRIEEAAPDLAWIGRLPGTKIMIRGNHDYWWTSLSKAKSILPPSCQLIQNNSVLWNDIAIGGARLWDVPGLSFNECINFKEGSSAPIPKTEKELEDSQNLYERELIRLETSLKSMSRSATKKIVMTHYPPIGLSLEETAVSKLLDRYEIDYCLFGHLHNVKNEKKLFGQKGKTTYCLTACDYLDFQPLCIC